jgi:hypothetical protein
LQRTKDNRSSGKCFFPLSYIEMYR